MILLLNKQYREENGMINDLAKKIKKSTVLECKILGNTEIYTLDNIIVSFDIFLPLAKRLEEQENLSAYHRKLEAWRIISFLN